MLLRAHDSAPLGRLFGNKLDPRGIQQGKYSTCSVVGAMISVANYIHGSLQYNTISVMLKGLIRPAAERFQVGLRFNGVRRLVWVDDTFACEKDECKISMTL